jgi:sulfite exporter TauE/SafE
VGSLSAEIRRASAAGRCDCRPGCAEGPALPTAAALGFATPLLPCGPLYFILAAALLAGSALRGAEFMLAFGLGTVPLLWLAQSQFHRLQARLSPPGSAACA